MDSSDEYNITPTQINYTTTVATRLCVCVCVCMIAHHIPQLLHLFAACVAQLNLLSEISSQGGNSLSIVSSPLLQTLQLQQQKKQNGVMASAVSHRDIRKYRRCLFSVRDKEHAS